MKTTLIAITLTGLALVPAAQAQSEETFPFEFQYSSQELTSEQGAKEVYDRLRDQVKDACEFTNSRRGVLAANIEKKCIDQAVDNAVRNINSQKLTVAHSDETETTQS